MGNKKNISLLILYTGGTIGMIKDPDNDVLIPFPFDHIIEKLPELKRFGYHIKTESFHPPIDSSNMGATEWIQIAQLIKENSKAYDGFVILQGTDTMAYSASAVSFLLLGLKKPVIFTGSQLPLGTLRTDGKENIITAIEIAAAKQNGESIIQEVCIYFENHLYRANRTTKHNTEYFNAFRSYNYPALAEAGIEINYNNDALENNTSTQNQKFKHVFDTRVLHLRIFPGMYKKSFSNIIQTPDIKGIILETFGSGNAFTDEWFIETLEKISKKGIYIINITQCRAGSVDMDRYETGRNLKKAGVLSGYDMTPECALTKLMFLLAQDLPQEQFLHCWEHALAGELSNSENYKK